MRFLIDSMAGKLARYMRLLGFDTIYSRKGIREEDVRKSKEEGRIILTRNRRLEGENIFILPTEKTEEQIIWVMKKFNLKGLIKPFSRCMECNGELRKMKKDDVKGKVPFYVYLTQEAFSQCSGCGKLYWMGTHGKKLKKKIEKIIREL